jgi:hypothetical protein
MHRSLKIVFPPSSAQFHPVWRVINRQIPGLPTSGRPFNARKSVTSGFPEEGFFHPGISSQEAFSASKV